MMNECVNTEILWESKMVHSENSFLLWVLESFHECSFLKKGWRCSADLFITLAGAGPSLLLPSSVLWPPQDMPALPRVPTCLAQAGLCHFPPRSPSFFCWACLEPVLRGLKSSLSGHQSFFLLTLGCPQSNAEEAGKFPQLLARSRQLCRKKRLYPLRIC